MKTVGVYTMQGGVGKTAAAVNLAYLAALGGERTLLCDLDPQGAASFYFGLDTNQKTSAKKLVKEKSILEKTIVGSGLTGLDILPSDLSYRKFDFALEDMKKPKKRLQQLLQPLEKMYSWVFLDCPPGLSLISENVFYASSSILLPIRPTPLSLNIYCELMEFLGKKKIEELRIIPFLSQVDESSSLHSAMVADIREAIPALCRTVIYYDPFIAKMGVERKPITMSDPSSGSAVSFSALWQEVRQLLN